MEDLIRSVMGETVEKVEEEHDLSSESIKIVTCGVGGAGNAGQAREVAQAGEKPKVETKKPDKLSPSRLYTTF